MNITLSNISNSERLVLWRKRHNYTQSDAATDLGVSVNQISLWENNTDMVPRVELKGRLSFGEKCVIMRRRSGLGQREVAKKVGCCPYWLRLMEMDKVQNDKLVKFWESNS